MEEVLAKIREHSEKYPKPELGKRIEYGTAGFRDKSIHLPHVMFRIGILSALRAMERKATIGVIVTASHNPEEDNGAKIIDPLGEMLDTSWESLATDIVNTDDLEEEVKKIIEKFDLDLSQPALVFVGRDTRLSGVPLSDAVIDGVQSLNKDVQDFGILTTPQLHYIIRCKNTNGEYGEPTEEGYYKKLCSAFCEIRGENFSNGHYMPKIRVDGANGVGALKIKKIIENINGALNIEIYNGGTGRLNYLCGADYVKIEQKPPEGVPLDAGVRCISLDGDADRLIYFYIHKWGMWRLLDGDKMAILIADYLKSLVKESGLDLKVGLVQTAYANGNSTIYAETRLKIPVICVPTGVKYLHHAAQKFDIGVYFEANGHGTVVLSEEARSKIKGFASSGVENEEHLAAKKLDTLCMLINETVGDAISDLLLIETILHAKAWSLEDWDGMYSELNSCQAKVKVKDRNAIKTTNAERQCVEPPGLQEALDNIVAQFPSPARVFVRPSGTEDIVRIYAEASSAEHVSKLIYESSCAVYSLAEGVGDEPRPIQ